MKNQRITNKGSALPIVMMVMLVSFILASIVIALVNSQEKTESFYENNVKALHAAEIGVNQYLWFINKISATPIATDGSEIIYQTTDQKYVYTLELLENTAGKKVLKSTGWVYGDSSVKRTVEVTFNKRSYAEYVYFSNDDAGILWTTGERCYGPYRTNGTLVISGFPIFYQSVFYGVALNPLASASNNLIFKVPPAFLAPDNLPISNNPLMAEAIAQNTCYQGRTSILLRNDGTILVWNPANVTTPWVTLDTAVIDVIYVNGPVSTNKANEAAGNVFVSGVLSGKLTIAASNNIYITDFNATRSTLAAAKGDPNGRNGITYANTTFSKNIIAEGVVDDPVVVPATATDMLGLVPGNNCEILTYGWYDIQPNRTSPRLSNNDNAASAVGDITVCAAILAGTGRFGNSDILEGLPNFPPASLYVYPKKISTGGNNYTLTIWGSIIQNVRGAVGWVNDGGYIKDYAYDNRLLFENPPHFPEPANAGWEINKWY